MVIHRPLHQKWIEDYGLIEPDEYERLTMEIVREEMGWDAMTVKPPEQKVPSKNTARFSIWSKNE